ncbi:LytR C-terminal domain-containing protein [Streptomyces sp. NPDC051018]|uniref:LCP family protein n=1 Tax=Streptomyces sp. NPDC051018 TaxID=3365639 RepID=UPI00379C6B8E
MNDQNRPYDPYHQEPQIIGYDEYGQPVYQQPQQYDPYAQQQTQHPDQHQYQQGQAGGDYGYDPYAPQQPTTGEHPPYDPYAQPPSRDQDGHGTQGGQDYPYGNDGGAYGDAYTGGGYSGSGDNGYSYGTGGQPAAVDTTRQWDAAQQYQQTGYPAESPTATAAPGTEASGVPSSGAAAPGFPAEGSPSDGSLASAAPGRTVPGPRRPGDGERDYRTEQFSFIEEPDEDSEDVIDWLKFTESRSERREEAKRRGRHRVVALVVVLALVVLGGVGYLWAAGKLPGLSDGESSDTATGPQKRDVIVVHLHNTKKKGATSTALLVDNVTTQQGTTVLLPNALSVANDDGTGTTLGKSVEDDGSVGTREAVGSLLGAKITGTWRLDTPFLENLVELVGTIDLTTDTAVPGDKQGAAPLVKKGENQTLNGRAAVAYATYTGPGEAEADQLQRFGQVMQAVLKKFPSEPKSATVTVETLGQILDPSLTEKDLGASLAKLAEHAKGGDYRTALLPVQQDGTLTEEASSSVVKDILGGSVTAPEQGAAVRVGIKNGTGKTSATETARVSLVNGGYAVIDSGKAETVPASRITYGDDAKKEEAAEVAKTLGLPAGAVKKGTPAANADISVVLGKDFRTGG